jgi:hypothetical protein
MHARAATNTRTGGATFATGGILHRRGRYRLLALVLAYNVLSTPNSTAGMAHGSQQALRIDSVDSEIPT